MISLFLLLQMQTANPTCEMIRPLLNFKILKERKYDVEEIPDRFFCEDEQF